jgi:hypothetical protein
MRRLVAVLPVVPFALLFAAGLAGAATVQRFPGLRG